MKGQKSKAAIAALITAGAIAFGAVTGGAFPTSQAHDAQDRVVALNGRKAGSTQQEYMLLALNMTGPRDSLNMTGPRR